MSQHETPLSKFTFGTQIMLQVSTPLSGLRLFYMKNSLLKLKSEAAKRDFSLCSLHMSTRWRYHIFPRNGSRRLHTFIQFRKAPLLETFRRRIDFDLKIIFYYNLSGTIILLSGRSRGSLQRLYFSSFQALLNARPTSVLGFSRRVRHFLGNRKQVFKYSTHFRSLFLRTRPSFTIMILQAQTAITRGLTDI